MKSYFRDQIFSKGGIFLDSNEYVQDPYSKYQFIAGLGVKQEYILSDKSSYDQLDSFKKWYHEVGFCLGFISYDFKNCLEHLSSDNPTLLPWPILHFIQPEWLVYLMNNQVHIYSDHDIDAFLRSNILVDDPIPASTSHKVNYILEVPDKATYLHHVAAIRQHIIDGDVYELNYCRHFELGLEDKIDLQSLNNLIIGGSAAPFSGVYSLNGKSCISASPERFFCKRGESVYSQPIKGTIARGKSNEEDENNKSQLLNSEKDRAENIMIVDLVRNDLSRVCVSGTVHVKELFGIYSFTGVHQMISTVSGTLYPNKDIFDLIMAAFPMGSMTGAPKIKAMELIDYYEQFQRGAFSGSLGYIDFEGDGDFNVIIRSLLIDHKENKAFLPVGGAIVFDSDPEEEYQESLLKASRILGIFNQENRYS